MKILTIYLSLCDINAIESNTSETLFSCRILRSVEAYDIDINISSHHIRQNQNLSLLYAFCPLKFEKENSILQVMCLLRVDPKMMACNQLLVVWTTRRWDQFYLYQIKNVRSFEQTEAFLLFA